MTRHARQASMIRVASLLAGLLVPTLALVPFGSLWLWQQGYILYWAIAAAAFVAPAFAAQWWLLRAPKPSTNPPEATETQARIESGDPSWTPAEEKAWADVVALARSVDVSRLDSREAIIGLGTETVRTVAQRLHPEVSDPLWQFTVPEACSLVERISRRLGAFAADNIPLSDRFTVAQALALYEWRGAVGLAEKAYSAWRIIRVANPLSAATHELREQLSKQMLEWGREHVTQRLAHAYVTEVGRAAIDLYGGRLRIPTAELPSPLPADTPQGATPQSRAAEPLRILIGGQVGAGKSSLVNALAAEIQAEVDALPATASFTTYRLRRPEFPDAKLIDSPGLAAPSRDLPSVIEQADACDLILWVVAAHRADREIDRQALAGIRAAYAAKPDRRQPPLLLILSHVDKLRPLLEWDPPYDLQSLSQAKSASIRAVVDTVAEELGTPAEDVVPVCLLSGAAYNVDAVWARIFMALPDAQRAHLVRRIRDARTGWDWPKIWTQAVGAGRVLGKTLRRQPGQARDASE